MPNCKQCNTGFEVTDEDRAFYDKVSPVFNGKKCAIPEPTFCPDCRRQRRLTWRNEKKLHKRKCDLCEKSIISMYRPDVTFPVYCLDCWWGDGWDPYEFDQEFDFNKPFFEQFMELRNKIPHFSLSVKHSSMENSDYCSQAGFLKNCYLLICANESEQCLYGNGIIRCFDCVDCLKVYDCEACYEVITSNNCTFSTYLVDSNNCDQCHFSANLVSCKNCFGCYNLRNKEYYFFNEKLSPNDYKTRVEEALKQKSREEIWKEFNQSSSKRIAKWMQEKNTENCTGNYLTQSKNCFDCFDSEYVENSKYCIDLKKGAKINFENYDVSFFGVGIDASYECTTVGNTSNHLLFCNEVWELTYDALYSLICVNSSHHIFGCVGIKHGEYSILNKKYSESEYNEMVPKIIEHMKSTGEWGEFFPAQFSPYSYNETVAQEHHPLTKEDVLKKGLKWHNDIEADYSGVTDKIPAAKLPKNIDEVPDDILNWAIECEKTGRLFKVQKLELDFYRKNNLPVPHFHPDVRSKNRFKMLNPHRLYDRNCNKCSVDIQTTYSPDRPEKIYCEACYLKEVY